MRQTRMNQQAFVQCEAGPEKEEPERTPEEVPSPGHVPEITPNAPPEILPESDPEIAPSSPPEIEPSRSPEIRSTGVYSFVGSGQD